MYLCRAPVLRCHCNIFPVLHPDCVAQTIFAAYLQALSRRSCSGRPRSCPKFEVLLLILSCCFCAAAFKNFVPRCGSSLPTSAFLHEELAPGRVARISFANGPQECAFWIIHNHGLSEALLAVIAARLRADFLEARARPLEFFVAAFGDFNLREREREKNKDGCLVCLRALQNDSNAIR